MNIAGEGAGNCSLPPLTDEEISHSSDWWDKHFLNIAREVSASSKDPSTKVGIVIVKNKIVVGTGYNGFPRGVRDLRSRYDDRETKYALVVHGEPNAILMAGDRASGATLYAWPFPVCSDCCKLIIQAGIKRIVCVAESDPERKKRWEKSMKYTTLMCNEAGVVYEEIDFS